MLTIIFFIITVFWVNLLFCMLLPTLIIGFIFGKWLGTYNINIWKNTTNNSNNYWWFFVIWLFSKNKNFLAILELLAKKRLERTCLKKILLII